MWIINAYFLHFNHKYFVIHANNSLCGQFLSSFIIIDCGKWVPQVKISQFKEEIMFLFSFLKPEMSCTYSDYVISCKQAHAKNHRVLSVLNKFIFTFNELILELYNPLLCI